MLTSQFNSVRLTALCALLLCAFVLATPFRTLAQATAAAAPPAQTERERAFQLFKENKYEAALPLFEKLAIADPSDVAVTEFLGFTLVINGTNLNSGETRKAMLLRGRNVLLRAKELGANDALLESVLAKLSPNGESVETKFSENAEADAAVHAGETAFAKGDNDQALAHYERALKLDPKAYDAALFAGDVYFQQQAWDKAYEWYGRAVLINPNRETAYRYWSDAYLKSGKMNEARDKSIEAIIAEPYNQIALQGLIQWAQANEVELAHPKIEQPAPSMQSSRQGDQTTIMIDPKKLDTKSPDHYWTSYDLVRSTYRTAHFPKEYPNEKAYRHSLKEEALALRIVAELAASDLKSGKIKTLDPSLTNLVKLSDAGLIEAYVLFVRVDEGIARDYEDYRKANRDKLRRYWTDIVVAGATKP